MTLVKRGVRSIWGISVGGLLTIHGCSGSSEPGAPAGAVGGERSQAGEPATSRPEGGLGGEPTSGGGRPGAGATAGGAGAEPAGGIGGVDDTSAGAGGALSTSAGQGGGGQGGDGEGGASSDATCASSPVEYVSYLSPQHPDVASGVAGLSPEQQRALLSGGQRVTPDWWTIDFDASGSPALGLDDMPLRNGSRGVAQLDGGEATTWAVAAARGASFDVDLEYRVGAAQGREMRAFKYEVALAPMLDVLRHPGWGRAQESYGEDPVVAGNLGAAFIRGLQDEKVMACPGHIGVYEAENNRGDGDAEANGNRVLDAQTLHENYTRSFEIAVEKADPACMMTAYNRVNGARAAQSHDLLTQIARNEWRKEEGGGWTGFMVSSRWATVANQGATSLLAGLDLEMPDNNAFRSLATDVNVSARVTEAATRIVNARYKFGHHTAEHKSSPLAPEIVDDPDHRSLARETALKGAVLLKNKGILPLPPSASVVFLGPDAALPAPSAAGDRPSGLGDGGSSRTVPPYAISYLSGLKSHPSASAMTITSSPNAAAAASADVAIIPVVMGWEDEGEGYDVGRDRVDLTLSGAHPVHWTTKPGSFIAQAAAANPNVIVLLTVGSAIVMEDWMASANAIVQTFYPGQEGGNALAQLLLGEVNFSGKLPFTIARSSADYPTFSNTTAGDVTIDYYHGYRKLDHEGKTPRFWFGFGLSYTSYAYGELEVLCAEGVSESGALRVVVPVTNTGTMAGEEVVQLYVGYPSTDVRRPIKELKAFARVHLEPGQTKRVNLSVPARDLRYWSQTGWKIQPGEHRVYVGPSADPANLKSAPFNVYEPR